MPVTKTAEKALRKASKNALENVSFKLGLKKLIKQFTKTPSQEILDKVYSALDKAKKKNIYHKNKVSRLKSVYSAKLATTSKKSMK